MSYYDKLKIFQKLPQNQGRHSKRLITLDQSLDVELEKRNIFSQQKIVPQQFSNDTKKGSNHKKESVPKFQVVQNSTQPKNRKQNLPKQEPIIIQDSAIKQFKQKNKKKYGKQLKQLKKKKQQKTQRVQSIQKVEKALKEQKKIQILDVPQFDLISKDEEQYVHGVSIKSWLSLTESFSLSLGHFFYSYNFPIRRQIPIIANNLDLQRQKYENGTYISQSFDNNLQVSFILFFLKAVIIQNFFRLSVILWIAAIVLSFIISDKQYKPGKQILLGIFVVYCILSVILQLISLRNRRSWQQSSKQIKYKVYHYDNENRTAQWVLTDVTDLRPGNIYKLPAPTVNKASKIPADSVLLHGPRSILQVDDSSIIQYLSPLEKQQRIGLKQTLIKQQIIMLPLTGVIHYQLVAPQITQQNIYGKFMIQQPKQQTLNITYNNVMLRGTCILSSQMIYTDDSNKIVQQKQSQILAIVLQTGIDSLVLKTSQYPYQYRKQYTFVKLIDILLIVCSILYILMVGSGILIGYIYLANQSINRGYYIETYLNLGQQPVTLTQIVLQHLASLIMIVPIILRISYLLYINIAGPMIANKLDIQIKDYNMITQTRQTQVLVTTIGGDLIRMGDHKYSNNAQDDDNTIIFDISNDKSKTKIRNRSLQSIRVGGIHHNFITTKIDTELYAVKDIDMMCYFMSVALLTCNRRNPTPLEGGIIERANKTFKIKIQKNNNIIKIGKLKVIKIFTIPATEKYPYKVLFYKHAGGYVQDVQQFQNMKPQNKQRILCLVRGETVKLTEMISEIDGGLLSQFSMRLHQQKGYHIQLLGKFVISHDDFVQVKKSYLNIYSKNKDNPYSQLKSDIKLFGIDQFYEDLNKYMRKIDPMGLLIWQNPYSILSKNLLPISSLPQLQFKIIIAPPSKSQINPQFQSIHTITNYLLKTSKLQLKQISNKILHNYSNKETFWALLKVEKILVLNGWNYSMIKKLLADLKQIKRKNKKQIKFIGYVEQDQYAWVLKQTDVSISTKGDGYDLQKYSDIIINQETSSTTTDIIRRLFVYAEAHNSCIQSIIIIQVMKSVLLATIEFINHFFSWGTSLVIIGTPLYLVLQIGILLDFLYYLFPLLDQDVWTQVVPSEKQSKILNKQKQQEQSKKGVDRSSITAQRVLFEILISIGIGAFLTFIPVYSMTEPPTKYGTIEPKEFTNVLIHFILYHALVFRKIFMKPYNFSIYKLFIIIIQIAVYYLGLLIVSAVDNYQYKGIIWYIFQAKLIIVGLFSVWMITGVFWLYFMLQNIIYPKSKIIHNTYEKLPKKVQEVSIQQEQTVKVGQAVQIQ